MKKILSILVLLVAIGIKANAQTEVLFKLKVSPDHHYVSTMKMDMDMAMTVSGAAATKPGAKGTKPVAKTGKAAALAKQVKKDAPPKAMQMTMGYAVIGDTKTGAATGDKIPFTMAIKMQMGHMKMNGKDMPAGGATPAIDQTLYGNFDGGAIPEIDSVGGKGGDPMKAAMAKMAKAFQAGLKFPDKPLKVGDTFVQTMPMDMPVAGMQMKLNSTVTYKLVSIDNNKANFDLMYVLSTDIDAKGVVMSMTGGGDGKMVYDISESYPVDMMSNMNIAYKMVMPQAKDAKMDGKVKMAMGVQTTISKN